MLNKLLNNKPIENWIKLVSEYGFSEETTKNKSVSRLIKASINADSDKIRKACRTLLEEYYGK